MTPPDSFLTHDLEALAKLLRPIAKDDPRVAQALGSLRHSLDAWFETLGLPSSSATSDPRSGAKSEGRGRDSRGPQERAGRPTREFRADIRWVPERARLKAEACSLALAQLRAERKPEADAAESSEEAALFGRAKALPECYLWALDPKRTAAPENDLEVAAQCYENLAVVVELAQAEVQRRSIEEAPPRRLMSLMAEAQSGIYAMLARLGIRGDRDQLQAFAWLRERTDHFRIYIPRFMDRSRLAKPEDASDLARRIAEFVAEVTSARESSEVSAKLKYRLEKASDQDDELSDDWWVKVAESLEERAEQGGGELESELKEMLLSSLDRLRSEELGLSQSALSWLEAHS